MAVYSGVSGDASAAAFSAKTRAKREHVKTARYVCSHPASTAGKKPTQYFRVAVYYRTGAIVTAGAARRRLTAAVAPKFLRVLRAEPVFLHRLRADPGFLHRLRADPGFLHRLQPASAAICRSSTVAVPQPVAVHVRLHANVLRVNLNERGRSEQQNGKKIVHPFTVCSIQMYSCSTSNCFYAEASYSLHR